LLANKQIEIDCPEKKAKMSLMLWLSEQFFVKHEVTRVMIS